MRIIIENQEEEEQEIIKAGDLIVAGTSVALVCQDKTDDGMFYMVNLTNGSLWSKKHRNAHRLVQHYFDKGKYELYKSNEAKLMLNKK